MPVGLAALAFLALVAVTVIAAGVYVGVLRALDVYFGDRNSVFLSGDAGARDEIE